MNYQFLKMTNKEVLVTHDVIQNKSLDFAKKFGGSQFKAPDDSLFE